MLYTVTVHIAKHVTRQLRYVVEATNERDARAIASAEARLHTMSEIKGADATPVGGQAFLYDGGAQ